MLWFLVTVNSDLALMAKVFGLTASYSGVSLPLAPRRCAGSAAADRACRTCAAKTVRAPGTPAASGRRRRASPRKSGRPTRTLTWTGGKTPGMRRPRRSSTVAEQLAGASGSRGRRCDLAHVPDHLALGIEIGRADHAECGHCDTRSRSGEHPPVDVLGDEVRAGAWNRRAILRRAVRPGSAAWPTALGVELCP